MTILVLQTVCLTSVHLIPEPVIVCPDLPCKSGRFNSGHDYLFSVITGCSPISNFSFTTEPDVAPCIQRPVDLVFLLDSSERLGLKEFDYIHEFLHKVADRLGLAQSDKDSMRARLALIEFSDIVNVAFPLTHDPAIIAEGMKHVPKMETSSEVGPAIIFAIDNILGKGRTLKTRPNAEVSFVFITDGITGSNHLEEAVSAMRSSQVVSTVIATGSDIDQEVLTKLAMGDQNAIFKFKDFSGLSRSALFDRFIRWVC